MQSTSGLLSINPESSSSQSSVLGVALEIARLLAFGVAAVVVHLWLRNRLGLGPGHQGTVWIALMVTGRLTSKMQWAGVTSAMGASAMALAAPLGLVIPFAGCRISSREPQSMPDIWRFPAGAIAHGSSCPSPGWHMRRSRSSVWRSVTRAVGRTIRC